MVEANKHVGNIIRNLTDHGPITALDAFQRLLEAGKAARRNDPGLYGDAKEFSSAILKVFSSCLALHFKQRLMRLHKSCGGCLRADLSEAIIFPSGRFEPGTALYI